MVHALQAAWVMAPSSKGHWLAFIHISTHSQVCPPITGYINKEGYTLFLLVESVVLLQWSYLSPPHPVQAPQLNPLWKVSGHKCETGHKEHVGGSGSCLLVLRRGDDRKKEYHWLQSVIWAVSLCVVYV